MPQRTPSPADDFLRGAAGTDAMIGGGGVGEIGGGGDVDSPPEFGGKFVSIISQSPNTIAPEAAQQAGSGAGQGVGAHEKIAGTKTQWAFPY